MENEVQNILLSFYKKKFESWRNIKLFAPIKISSGWENEIYSFAIGHEEAGERKHEELILRLYPGSGAQQKALREFNGMKKLHELGFPVPQVLILELDDSFFGKPFVIMEKINGRLMGSVIGESNPEKRQELITLFCKIFVDLHTLDWKPFTPDPSVYETGDPYTFINRVLAQIRGYIDRFRRDSFVPALNWLKERSLIVPCERLSVIHFDYHPYNILLRDDDKAFVIDWTNIDVADFRLDLAWTILLMSTYGHPEVRGIILGEYERIAGCKIQQIEYFEVIASLRRLFSILVSLSEGPAALGMRPEAAEMIKRNISHIKNVYSFLYDRTGITIPDVETLITSLSE